MVFDMVNLVNYKVQKMIMPTKTIQQQRESSSVKESMRLAYTALEDKADMKICIRMEWLC